MHTTPTAASELRAAAERQLAARATQFPRGETQKGDDMMLIRELELHQIELEMQGAALAETRTKLEALRVKYQDLYELAPVSFFTLSEAGEIIELNRHAATALHLEHEALVGRKLRDFVDAASLQAWDSFLRSAKDTGEEVAVHSLMIRARLPKYVNAQAHAYNDVVSGTRQIRVAVMDVTLLKMAHDDALRALKAASGFGDL